MKSTFFEYNMHALGYVDGIKRDALIILDTNSLLNLYRYSRENREKFFEILNTVKDRLFLANKSVEEFYRNRTKIIKYKSGFKKSLKEELENELNSIENKVLNSNFKCKSQDSCNLLKYEHNLKDNIIKSIKDAKDNINKSIDDYKNDVQNDYFDDQILNKITQLFDGKVNQKFSDDKLKEIYNEGKNRYSKKMPPGYEDLHKNKKPEPDCYGDLIIWKEIIDISKKMKKDILFVSDDTKEDWREKINGKDLGPRKELIREFKKETNNMFYSFTTSEFIKNISELYNIQNTEKLEDESKVIKEDLDKSKNIVKKKIYKIYREDLARIIEAQSILDNKKYDDILNKSIKSIMSDEQMKQAVEKLNEQGFSNDYIKKVILHYLKNKK